MRTERDSMGEVQVPSQAYYGAQTQRAVENFPISGWTLPSPLVHALGLVKLACAEANHDLGKLTGSGTSPLTKEQVAALLAACREVADGKLDDEFPVDVFQTGSGTSSNMNLNEVISNRAIELAGGDRFSPVKTIHPNDHVNMGQSTNDTFPTAIHVARRAGDPRRSAARLAAIERCTALQSQPMGSDHQDRANPPDGRHAVATRPRDRRDGQAGRAVLGAGAAGDASGFGASRGRHGGRVRHQHSSRVWSQSGGGACSRNTD